MTVYLIKQDTYEIFNSVIEWTKDYIVYKAGRGTAKIYAGENEYFTNEKPTSVEQGESHNIHADEEDGR